jgi:hypothetical protein
MKKEENSIALLIDCDNISHNSIEGIINELSKYGVINIKNAYGTGKVLNSKAGKRNFMSLLYSQFSSLTTPRVKMQLTSL